MLALQHTPGRRMAVQAGGHVGIFGKALAAEFEAVYCFEPSPKLFPLLVQNAPEGNIFRFQCALGSVRGLVGLSTVRRDGSGKPEHEGLTHVVGSGLVPVLQIDDLGLKRADLLYLDVEGAELQALKGAVNTINYSRPTIGCEVNRWLEAAGDSEEALRQFMKDIGYREAAAVRSDVIFVPEERSNG